MQFIFGPFNNKKKLVILIKILPQFTITYRQYNVNSLFVFVLNWIHGVVLVETTQYMLLVLILSPLFKQSFLVQGQTCTIIFVFK